VSGGGGTDFVAPDTNKGAREARSFSRQNWRGRRPCTAAPPPVMLGLAETSPPRLRKSTVLAACSYRGSASAGGRVEGVTNKPAGAPCDAAASAGPGRSIAKSVARAGDGWGEAAGPGAPPSWAR
jgi:hypothetical protein